jgi:hypothetical protein
MFDCVEYFNVSLPIFLIHSFLLHLLSFTVTLYTIYYTYYTSFLLRMIRYLHGNMASVVYFLYCENNNPNSMLYDIITLSQGLLIFSAMT